jgi:hypothetical protein
MCIWVNLETLYSEDAAATIYLVENPSLQQGEGRVAVVYVTDTSK